MPPLLIPYDGTIRPGTGYAGCSQCILGLNTHGFHPSLTPSFNTATHQVCVDNAVKPALAGAVVTPAAQPDSVTCNHVIRSGSFVTDIREVTEGLNIHRTFSSDRSLMCIPHSSRSQRLSFSDTSPPDVARPRARSSSTLRRSWRAISTICYE